MNLYLSLQGMVDAELTSADISSSLQTIAQSGIPIRSVRTVDSVTAVIRIPRKSFVKLYEHCLRRGESVKIISRQGMYWNLMHLRKRPVLVLGLLILFLSALYLPTRILNIRVEGNHTVPSRRILEAAEYSGIRFGASRREVRSERVKNRLLQQIPQLQWVGVNTRGCVAVISVRERCAEENTQTQSDFGNVVAIREGIVTSCTATRGNLLCQEGQAVAEGQVLISGYTDCGLMIQICQADGEVFAQTKREIQAVFPAMYAQKTEETSPDRKYSLLIGKKRINLWKDSGIWDATCGRIYTENYITLPGGFALPLGWAVDVYFTGNTQQAEYPPAYAQEQLCAYADGYVKQQTVAGTIQSREISTYREGDIYWLEGEYLCTEMIGKRQTGQIGEVNEQSG